AIYRWITDRVAYDAEGFLSGKRGDNSAEGALQTRKVVCEGYANLFDRLSQEAGVEVVKIRGIAKGVSFKESGYLARSGHAWNAVRLDGTWHLIDSTWGAGRMNREGQFAKNFDPFYFLTPPDQLIFSHYPQEPKWQLLDPQIASEEFRRLPKIDRRVFQ